MTPTEWLAALAEPRRTELSTLHRLIRKAAPGFKPFVKGSMLGYGAYHYRYESGREGDSFRVGLADNKQAMSLYVVAANERGYLAEQFRARLPKASIGKSCIRFKKLEQLDLEVVEALVRAATRTPALGEIEPAVRRARAATVQQPSKKTVTARRRR